MTTRYLLDTSIVSAPVAKQPDPNVLRHLDSYGHECAIAAPVWNELVYGCQRLPRGRRRDIIDAYLTNVVAATLPVLPYDAVAAHWHGLERARLEGLGKTAPYVDGQIAGIAHVQALTLVTLNVKDFARFKGLQIEDWSKRRS